MVGTLADIPLPFKIGMVMLVVQVWGGVFSAMMWLNSVVRNAAPHSPNIFQVLTDMSSGLVAFPFFIFSTAFFTSRIVIDGACPEVDRGRQSFLVDTEMRAPPDLES